MTSRIIKVFNDECFMYVCLYVSFQTSQAFRYQRGSRANTTNVNYNVAGQGRDPLNPIYTGGENLSQQPHILTQPLLKERPKGQQNIGNFSSCTKYS